VAVHFLRNERREIWMDFRWFMECRLGGKVKGIGPMLGRSMEAGFYTSTARHSLQ